jgi:hypothetical protein
MKEQFPAILTGDLSREEAGTLLDRWWARAQRSRLGPFVKVARTMRERRGLIFNAIEHGISNGRVEGLNTKVRLLVQRACRPTVATVVPGAQSLSGVPGAELVPMEYITPPINQDELHPLPDKTSERVSQRASLRSSRR